MERFSCFLRVRARARDRRALCLAGRLLLPALPDPGLHQLPWTWATTSPVQSRWGQRETGTQPRHENYLSIFRAEGRAVRHALLEAWPIAFRYAFATATLCLAPRLSVRLFLARAWRPPVRPALLMMVMLPFWTSFLLRVYAWKGILADQGLLNQLLMALGLTSSRSRCSTPASRCWWA